MCRQLSGPLQQQRKNISHTKNLSDEFNEKRLAEGIERD